METDNLPRVDREEWAVLYAAFAIVRKETERALAPWHVTVPQAIALVFLDEAKEPVTVSRLARFLLQESPSITTLVDRMCGRGLVERVNDPRDRRKVLIKLTDKGRQARKNIRKPALEIQGELFGVLSDEERTALKELLQKFRRANIRRLG